MSYFRGRIVSEEKGEVEDIVATIPSIHPT